MALRHTYRERLMDKIRAKAEGEVIVSEAAGQEQAAEVVDIMEALRRSLEGNTKPVAAKRAAPKRAPARAATGRKRKVS
jgi:non-homologous end joining protein Ku